MKVIQVNDIEDCFDGSFIKEIQLGQVLTREFIHYLGKEGTLEYFPTFARPFFRINNSENFTMKGVEGNSTIRTTLYQGKKDHYLPFIIQVINQFEPGGEPEK